MAKTKLSAKQTLDLARGFLSLSVAVGNYQIKHWKKLSKNQRRILEDYHWSLLNKASHLNVESVVLKTKPTAKDLKVLKQAAQEMSAVGEKVDSYKQFIRIAAQGVAFGGALMSGNAKAAAGSGKDLIQVMSA